MLSPATSSSRLAPSGQARQQAPSLHSRPCSLFSAESTYDHAFVRLNNATTASSLGSSSVRVRRRLARRQPCSAARPDAAAAPSPQAPSDSPAQSYAWSWEVEAEPKAPSTATISASATMEEVLAALAVAESEAAPLSPAAAEGLRTAVPPAALAALPLPKLSTLLSAVGRAGAGGAVGPEWRAAAAAAAAQALAQADMDDGGAGRQVAALLWGLSEMGLSAPEPAPVGPPAASLSAFYEPPPAGSGAQPAESAQQQQQEAGLSPAWFEAAEGAILRGIQAGAFLAPDLATSLCGLGAMGAKPGPAWLAEVMKECQLQLSQFLADWSPPDIARLASGLSDLRAQPAFGPDFSTTLMKAVYSKVRTINDKAAVDFALAKLETEDRSMHYDPRWTHEELHWLPRRERDKRRILSEGWYRTQWGGWAAGSKK